MKRPIPVVVQRIGKPAPTLGWLELPILGEEPRRKRWRPGVLVWGAAYGALAAGVAALAQVVLF